MRHSNDIPVVLSQDIHRPANFVPGRLWGKAFAAFAIVLSSLSGFADSELYFPANKNGVTVFPPKIDYQLSDQGMLKIGQTEYALGSFTTGLVSSKKRSGRYSLAFRFTAKLFKSGSLQLLGPDGKEVMSLAKNNVSNGITSIDGLTNETLKELSHFAYLRMCFSQKDDFTLIRACGVPFFIGLAKETPSFHAYQSSGEATLLANGAKVDPIGTLVLNNLEDTFSLQAIAANGAQLLLETKGQAYEFYDVTEGDSPNTMLLRIKGAKIIETYKQNASQQYLVPKQIQIKILTDGGISLSQELAGSQILPKESQRIILNKNYETKVVGGSLKLIGKTTGSADFKPSHPNDSVEKDADHLVWRLNDIDSSEVQRRELTVSRNGQLQTVRFDVVRDRVYDFGVTFGAAVDAASSTILELQRRFLQNWTVKFLYRKFLTERTNGIGWDSIGVNGGYDYYDHHFGLTLRNVMVQSNSALVPSIEYSHHFEVPLFFRGLGRHFFAQFEFPLSGSGDLTLADGLFINFFLQRELTENSYLKYGAGMNTLSFKNIATDTRSPQLWVSWGYHF